MMKISLKIKSLMASVAVSAAVALGGLSAQAANETLKIGFVGVTSGPAANPRWSRLTAISDLFRRSKMASARVCCGHGLA
jgi:hypothetical protein